MGYTETQVGDSVAREEEWFGGHEWKKHYFWVSV